MGSRRKHSNAKGRQLGSMKWRSLFGTGHLFTSEVKLCTLRRNVMTNAQTSQDGVKNVLSNCDETQVQLMKEECILVDENDKRIGNTSKKECHLLKKNGKGLLHRAFSVFLFNQEGQLLLQQRSDAKITFPGNFTNTCCSHPLYNASNQLEMEEEGAVGVRRAAQRKLHHELGISPQQVPVEEFKYLTRIQYSSNNQPEDRIWGENEIDYILFVKKDVDVHMNENEVKSYRYLNQEQLKHFIDTSEKEGRLITPWFRLITDKFLYKWWDKLDSIETQTDHNTIHRLS